MPNLKLNSDVSEKLVNLFTNRNRFDTVSLVFTSALSLRVRGVILFGALLCCFLLLL